MRFSNKYKNNLKKKSLICISCIAITVMLIALCKIASFSMPKKISSIFETKNTKIEQKQADGEVVYAGVQNEYGNCVEIKHIVNGETIYSFYAHLSKIEVEVGQKVVQGEEIGLEGGDPRTDPHPGSSTGHHLHFEIRKTESHGSDVNPHNYIDFR